jgi:hypothetical protein
MRFVDTRLAHRLESTDAYAGVAYARAHARLHPEVGSTSIEVAGGAAIFAGVDSPITQAFALGLSGPVEEDEVDRLEDFFRSRGAPVNVELCPYADPTIIEIFRERGYGVIEYSNVHARELQPDEKFSSYTGRLRVRKIVPTNACFLAEIDGVAAGGGLVTIHDGVATLAGTSTLPEFRGQGAQTAIIQARLAYAASQGCEMAMVTTMPGTISQRNVQRQGFQVVYSRSKLLSSGRWPVAGDQRQTI